MPFETNGGPGVNALHSGDSRVVLLALLAVFKSPPLMDGSDQQAVMAERRGFEPPIQV